MAERKTNSSGRPLIGIRIAGGLVWYYFGGGLGKHAATNMQNIYDQVATDAVTQYEITKRNGTAVDACAHAGLVSAAYLQAKNESQYQRWKSIETSDCAIAGLSR